MSINNQNVTFEDLTGYDAPARLSLSPTEKTAINTLKEMGVARADGSLDKAALTSLSKDQIKQVRIHLSDNGLYAGKDQKYYADGVAGSRTLQGLEKLLAKETLVNAATREGDLSQQDIKAIQTSLNTLGHDSGKADGIMGAKTVKAIEAFLGKENASAQNVSGSLRRTLEELGVKAEDKMDLALPQTIIEPGIEKIFGAYEHSRDDIRTLQNFLSENGHNVGKADGLIGNKTMKGLTDFLEANPGYHSAMGPNLTLETEIYALDNPVSDKLKQSLNLRDLTNLGDIDNNVRYEAYRNYFISQKKPEELARGIKVASELTGTPMQNLFAVMKQESIDFGDYTPTKAGQRGSSSANRIANNYGQFLDSERDRVTGKFGEQAQKELAREGIRFDRNEDWRDNPLVAPYMISKRLQESGSIADINIQYPLHVMPAFKGRENSNTRVASVYPAAADANRHIIGNRTFAQSYREIVKSIADDVDFERKLVLGEQLKIAEDELKAPADQKPVLFDRMDMDKPSFEKLAQTSGLGLSGVQPIRDDFGALASGEKSVQTSTPSIGQGLGFRASFGNASTGLKAELAENNVPRQSDNLNFVQKLAI